MLSFVLRLLFLTVIIWLVRRILVLFMGSARRPSRKPAAGGAANYMVKDPVCGMYMDSRIAVRLEQGNKTTYFCSDDCKKKFLDKSPEEKSAPEANP